MKSPGSFEVRSVALAATYVIALSMVCASCAWQSTQRWPGPMRSTREVLPPGDSAQHPPGPEEVAVVRHADPVQIRPAGALSGHPMEFYDKRARLSAGGAVMVSPGGRAEVLWPSGTSIVMFGEAVGWIGSTSRGEPLLDFTALDRARLDLQEGDSVRLLGGALLSGASGPYLLEHEADGTLLVHNQSKAQVRIGFREETFDLQPGQVVRIPLISSGGAPYVDDPALQRHNGPGFQVRLLGELDCVDEAGGVRVSAGPGATGREARSLGVRVTLAPGESVLFSDPHPTPTLEQAAERPVRKAKQN